LAPEPLRATGVGPEPLPTSNPLFFSVFLILSEIRRIPHVFFAKSEIGHSSDFNEVRFQKMEKKKGKGDPLKNNHPEKDKIRGTLVRLLWRAVDPGLKAPPLAAHPTLTPRHRRVIVASSAIYCFFLPESSVPPHECGACVHVCACVCVCVCMCVRACVCVCECVYVSYMRYSHLRERERERETVFIT